LSSAPAEKPIDPIDLPGIGPRPDKSHRALRILQACLPPLPAIARGDAILQHKRRDAVLVEPLGGFVAFGLDREPVQAAAGNDKQPGAGAFHRRRLKHCERRHADIRDLVERPRPVRQDSLRPDRAVFARRGTRPQVDDFRRRIGDVRERRHGRRSAGGVEKHRGKNGDEGTGPK
jgi:hypothetical protein